jgi:hypothetical protein
MRRLQELLHAIGHLIIVTLVGNKDVDCKMRNAPAAILWAG